VVSRDAENGSLTSPSDTVFGIGSGITALGFWGLVIDIAERYSTFQLSDVLSPDPVLWLFLGVFIIGLAAMGIAAAGLVARHGQGG
jgi:hypothetical protein